MTCRCPSPNHTNLHCLVQGKTACWSHYTPRHHLVRWGQRLVDGKGPIMKSQHRHRTCLQGKHLLHLHMVQSIPNPQDTLHHVVRESPRWDKNCTQPADCHAGTGQYCQVRVPEFGRCASYDSSSVETQLPYSDTLHQMGGIARPFAPL